MIRLIALLTAIGLCGCVAQHLNQGLEKLTGQNIQAAVAMLGYPDGMREMMGRTIYIWHTSQNTVLPITTFNNSYGTIGNVPLFGTTTGTEFVPTNLNCTIELVTDSHETIVNWKWSGNMSGCQSYASSLTRRS